MMFINKYLKIVLVLIVVVLIVATTFFGQKAIASDDETLSNLPLFAVLPLKGTVSSGVGDISESVYQRVSTSFFKTKRFELVERAQLDRVLNEGYQQHTVIADENSAVSLGKQLGVKTVVLGSYKVSMEHRREQTSRSYAGKFEINLRLVDVQTGKIKNVIRVSASNNSSSPTSAVDGLLNKAADKLDREVSNIFPLTGYIIKVINDREVLIDLGTKDGLTVGNEFNVVEYGEDIVHPVTGKVLKGEKKTITEFEIVRVSEETSVAQISGKDCKIRIGLLLESKPKKAGFWENTK